MKERKVNKKIRERVEGDLQSYPFWIVRLEVGGLGFPSKSAIGNEVNSNSIDSPVEDTLQYEEWVKKKVTAIEKVYDLLDDIEKKFVDYRYYQDNNKTETESELSISETKYYKLRNEIIIKFALGFGYKI